MELFPVPDVPEIHKDDNLAALISECVDPRSDDMVCVTSTVISKAKGRFTDLDDFPAGPRTRELTTRLAELAGDEEDPWFVRAVLEKNVDLVMSKPFFLTGTRFGHVGVNASIGRSDVPDHGPLLLSERPSESAERVRAGAGADRVVVTDTCGRPLRHGQHDVVIGWASLSASHNWRGETDRGGRKLGVTVESVVDKLATAANLMQGEGSSDTPAVVVHDFEWGGHDENDAHFRDVSGDFVRQALREWRYDLRQPA